MRRTEVLERRTTALEATVRALRERVECHLNVTQDPQVARVLERYPDMHAYLPRLG